MSHHAENVTLQFLNLCVLVHLPCNCASSCCWSVSPWLLKIIACFPLFFCFSMRVLLLVVQVSSKGVYVSWIRRTRNFSTYPLTCSFLSLTHFKLMLLMLVLSTSCGFFLPFLLVSDFVPQISGLYSSLMLFFYALVIAV